MTMRYHLDHPTQSAACGALSTVTVVPIEVFMTKPEALRCKRCLKVWTALLAGKPVYRGYDDGAGDTVARKP